MASGKFTPLERSLALLNDALITGIRGHNREAVKAAIEVLEHDGKSGLYDFHYRSCPVGKTLTDPQRPGLWFRNNKFGAIWLFNPPNGKSVVIGEYPGTSLDEARQKWMALREAVKKGEDPEVKTVKLKDLCDQFIKEYAMKSKRSWREDRRMFNHDLIPKLGARDVLSITRDDIEELLEGIIDRGSPRSAEKLLTAVRKMFNHVLEQTKKKRWVHGLEHNPCAHIKLAKRHTVSVYLKEPQIRAFVRNLPTVDKIPEVIRDILMLQFQTAARVGEVSGMMWDEVDLQHGIWTLPEGRSKNKQSHRVMLSRQSRAILKRREKSATTGFVFPAERSRKPYPPTLVTRRVREHHEVLGVPINIGTHGLRHTVLTQLASMGCGKELRDRISNHKDGSVDAIYQHYEHDKEARRWWQAWANRIDKLSADKKSTRKQGGVK